MKRKTDNKSNLNPDRKQSRKGVDVTMSVNGKLAGKLALMTVLLAFSGALFLQSCGNLERTAVPGNGEQSLLIDVYSARGTDSAGNPIVRANSKDQFQITATVRGLEALVGFFIPANWGTFQGGTPLADGYTYFPADEDGVVRAVLVPSAAAGSVELLAKSRHVTTKKKLTFDFATLTLFPSALVINGRESTRAYIDARGGVGPLEWWSSNPRTLKIKYVDADTIEVVISDDAELDGSSVTITVRDAEGATATATVTISDAACVVATMTVSPATVIITAGGGTTIMSVTIDDFDRRNSDSVEVLFTGDLGGAGIATYSLTLPQWNTPGVFQGSFGLSHAGLATGVQDDDFLEYSDLDGACESNVVAGKITWEGE